jgi:hypothetical protein
MAAIAVSADGENIYLALEDGSGFPVIAKTTRDDLSTFTAVYAPGAGTAANVAGVPSDADLMYFYGNFGSGAQVLKHVVSTGAETNISPTGLTTKVVNTLEVDPSDANIMQITVNTDQDLLASYDQGATWITLNAAVGFDVTAQRVFWAGDYDYDRAWLGGAAAGAAEARYSPNEGSYLSDVTGAALGATTGIVGIDGVEP